MTRCIGCRVPMEMPVGDMCDECRQSLNQHLHSDGYVPTAEERESMDEDMRDPTLFGDVEQRPDHDVDPNQQQDLPEDFYF